MVSLQEEALLNSLYVVIVCIYIKLATLLKAYSKIDIIFFINKVTRKYGVC